MVMDVIQDVVVQLDVIADMMPSLILINKIPLLWMIFYRIRLRGSFIDFTKKQDMT